MRLYRRLGACLMAAGGIVLNPNLTHLQGEEIISPIVSPTQPLVNLVQEGLSFSMDRFSGLDSRYHFNEEDLQKYQRWIQETITYSQEKGKPAIIVDKANYSLDFYQNGAITHTFPIELGFNSFDDKMREGDGATPEGKYKVSWVRDQGETAFYRAFLIDYPNALDWKEFNENRGKGTLTLENKIGGSIEIHGYGPATFSEISNWTLGCIAIHNDNLDLIFSLVKAGTPVTIVKYGPGSATR